MQTHAVAVREAIERARVVNNQWLQFESQNSPTTTTSTSASPSATTATNANIATHNEAHAPGIQSYTKTRTAHTGARASFVTVSPNDVLLALRIGSRLVVIDSPENKNSDFVRAVDALLVRAKKATSMDPLPSFTMSTDVDGKATVSIQVVPTEKGSATTLYYENGLTKERIDPIGVVNWFLG